ncbi:MAG: Fic family protein [Deltaproteobacteria bacterium]|nr:Fic family protein [Deltaproteobacteria bacterium]
MTITAPPYTLTPIILDLAERIGEAIGRAEDTAVQADLLLRRANRIRTIHGSLAIEGNTLTEEQVSTILEGRPVIAPLREVQEVRNAIKAYEQFPQWNPGREADLLSGHGVLMAGLLDAPGRYRRGGVGVMGPAEVHHIGPPADRVSHLMSNLLSWLDSTEEHPLIASSVFHYEFEFIHPFEDGNGRMGRLWQTLILTRWKPLFAHVPVESLVHARQSEYYEAIRDSSARGESTPFIVFMLEAILEAVRGFGATDQDSDQVSDQVGRLLATLRDGPKTATKLMAAFGLSHRPTFRENYIRPALGAGLIEMTRPESPTARNQKYRLTARGRAFKDLAN